MSQDELYAQAVGDFGPALERLTRSYEADPDKRRDLLQEIHESSNPSPRREETFRNSFDRRNPASPSS
jgi:hypothetical protein